MHDFREKVSMKELFIRSTKRVDGLAFYLLTLLYCLIGLIFVFDLQRYIPLPKGVHAPQFCWELFALIPLLFLMYCNLGYFAPSDSRKSQVWNATVLLTIGGLYLWGAVVAS